MPNQILLPNTLGALQDGQSLRRQRTQNALGDLALQNAPAQYEREQVLNQREDAKYQQGLDKDQAMQGIAAAKHVMQAPNARAFVLQNFPDIVPQFAQHGIDLNTATDDDVREYAAEFAAQLSAKIGLAPPTQMETMQGPDGSVLQRNPETGAMTNVLGRTPPNQQAPEALEMTVGRDGQPVYTPRSQAAGQRAYVAPTAASSSAEQLESVLDPATGNPVLVPRSQAAGRQPYQKPTGGLSPRDATTARNKLTQIGLAREQIALAREKFGALKGSYSAGLGGQYVPSQGGKEFDAAVDTMRSTITGIMRVPGVGAMSDYETRLDQAKMPTRGDYETVTAQKLDSLDSMLNQLEQGYGGILGDAGEQAQQQPAQGQPEVTATGPNGEKVVLRNGQWVAK